MIPNLKYEFKSVEKRKKDIRTSNMTKGKHLFCESAKENSLFKN